MKDTTSVLTPAKGVLRNYPIASFILLTFLITHILNPIVVETVRLLFSGASISFPMGYSLLGQYGPTIAGIFLVNRLYGIKGFKSTFHYSQLRKSHMKWLLLVFLMPLFLIMLSYFLAGASLSLLFNTITKHWLVYLSMLGGFFITAGFAEEYGWRGYMLPQLLKTKSALTSTLVIFVFHGLWHLPMFIGGWTNEPLHAWLPLVAGLTIIFSWLFFSTNGNLLIPIIFHACFDAQYAFFSKYIPDNSLTGPFHQGWTYVTSYCILGALIAVFTKGKLGFNSATFSPSKYFGSDNSEIESTNVRHQAK